MEIAVTTPRGHVGRPLVAALERAAVRPRLLARPDVLYLVVPDSLPGPDPVEAYAACGERVARAVAAAGVRRVVFQSSVGAEKRHGAGEIDGLARVEQTLDALDGVDVTHLRCGYFMSNLLLDETWRSTGVLETLTDQPLPWVAPEDIAVVAAGLLLNGDWHGRRVQAVHGPADLTFTQAAEVLGVRAERIGDDVMRARLQEAGMDEAKVESILGMSLGLRDGFVPEQPRSPVTTTPTTLAAWATALPPSAG